jgi:hypothetical protein
MTISAGGSMKYALDFILLDLMKETHHKKIALLVIGPETVTFKALSDPSEMPRLAARCAMHLSGYW